VRVTVRVRVRAKHQLKGYPHIVCMTVL